MRLPGFSRPRLSYANVTSTLALVLAISTGGAYAAATIGSSDIKKNAVQSKHIAGGAVKAGDLGGNAVTSAKVKDGTLTGKDLAGSADGVAMAGVTITQGEITHQFNRVGGLITVSGSTGEYDITIPGATFNGSQNLIYSVSGGTGMHCYVNNGGSGGDSNVEVRCRDFAGELTTGSFSLVVFEDVTSDPTPPLRTAPRTSADGS